MIHQIKTEELVNKARRGDRQSMNELIKLWYERVYHFLWRYTGDNLMAEEVCQHCFISVFNKIHQLKDAASFKSWMYRIAINEANYQLKYNNKHTKKDLSFAMQVESDSINSQQQMEQSERVDLVKKAILLLNPEQREVVIMKEYEGLKFREIAAILNLPINTVKSRMYYGLKSLRKSIQNHPIIKDLYNEAS